jgi:hypothetical protein
VRQGTGVIVGVPEGEGMAVGRSVGNSVLVGEAVMLGSSETVADGTSVGLGAREGAGAWVALAARQPETSAAITTMSAERVKNRRRANKLTFPGIIIPGVWGLQSPVCGG